MSCSPVHGRSPHGRSPPLRNHGWHALLQQDATHAQLGASCAGLAVAGAVLWAAANELLIQPKEYTCYNLALERIRWGLGTVPADHSWHS